MELSQLKYFAKAAELGNFTRAAEACLVSQPSLSQQIINLETELGQPLFERLGRQVRLTDAGVQFREYVDQAIGMIDRGRDQIQDRPDRGRLIIGAIPTVAPYLLPSLLKRFTAKVPKAVIELIEDVTDVLLERLLHGEIDVAFVALPISTRGLRTAVVLEEELLLALANDHPLIDKPRLSIKDLVDVPFILLGDTHCLSENALSFCHTKSFQPLLTSRVQQLSTVLELVALRQGVSLIPRMATTNDSSKLRKFRSIVGSPRRTIVIATNINRFQSQLSQRFQVLVKEYMAEHEF